MGGVKKLRKSELSNVFIYVQCEINKDMFDGQNLYYFKILQCR